MTRRAAPARLLALLLLAAPALSGASRLEQAQQHFAAGDLSSALAAVNQILEQDPENADAYYLRALIRDRHGELDGSLSDFNAAIQRLPDRAHIYHRRGEVLFKLGRFDGAVRDFDYAIYLEPDMEPHSWQRGIALYYAGKFGEAARQFELHRTVNPNDVENAAWHFLCVARRQGVEAAQAGLLPAGPDTRVPMSEIYRLYAGEGSIEQVFAAVEEGSPAGAEREARRFYANLYAGLYYDAHGDGESALHYVKQAAATPVPRHYMWHVARIHAAQWLP